MNLLSHFVSASHLPENGQLGSVLPDLLRLFTRRPRIQSVMALWQNNGHSPEMGEIVLGVDYHHHVDSLFHKAPLFTVHARALREAMEQADDTPGLKRFFAAHILLEIYLDHLLLIAKPDRSHKFYNLIADSDHLVPFVAHHPDIDSERFSGFVDVILEDRFWEDYTAMESGIARAERIMVRMGQRRFSKRETESILQTLETRKELILGELEDFFSLLKESEEKPLPSAGAA